MCVLGAFGARNDSAAKKIEEMSAYFRWKRIEFGKNWCSKWSFPTVVEKKI
jgi:hypothetical protein